MTTEEHDLQRHLVAASLLIVGEDPRPLRELAVHRGTYTPSAIVRRHAGMFDACALLDRAAARATAPQRQELSMIPSQNATVPTIEVVGGDAATWAVNLDGRTIVTCGNAAVARQAAERIGRTLEREGRTAAIRALADYFEENPNAPWRT